MSSADYNIVRYMPKYRDQVLSLQRRTWGSDLRAISDYFKWKHERSPYGNEPLVYLALCGDDVVGMRGFVRGEWRFGLTGKSVSAVMACDTVVRIDHESRGIFRRIMQFAMDDLRRNGFSCMLNLSASPVTYLRSLRDGWVPVQRFRPLRAETGIWTKVDQLHHSISRLPGLWRMKDNDFLYRLARRTHRDPKPRGHLTISSCARPIEMADLIQNSAANDCITQRRDARYLKWRFADPFTLYRYLYWDDGGLKGFLVLERRRNGSFGHVKIADWQAESRVVSRALLKLALESAKPAAISIWTGSRSENEIHVLEEAGFSRFDDTRGKKRYKPSLLFRMLDTKGEPLDGRDGNRLVDGAAWDVRMLFLN